MMLFFSWISRVIFFLMKSGTKSIFNRKKCSFFSKIEPGYIWDFVDFLEVDLFSERKRNPKKILFLFSIPRIFSNQNNIREIFFLPWKSIIRSQERLNWKKGLVKRKIFCFVNKPSFFGKYKSFEVTCAKKKSIEIDLEKIIYKKADSKIRSMFK